MNQLDYRCENCKFCVNTRDLTTSWVGLACTAVVHMDNRSWRHEAYIMQIGGTDTLLIVEKDFLCRLWQPKEV